jgi:predicted small lipoprotein YifL
MRLMIALLLVAGTLAACGRAGGIRAPGPADQITYPRSYPSR